MRRRWVNLRKGVLRAALPVLRCLSPRGAALAAAGFGSLEYRLVSGVRRSYRDAVEREAMRLGASWDVDEVARQLVANQIRARARDLLLEGQQQDELLAAIRVEGEEHLLESQEHGRGTIILSNHFGSTLIGAYWLIGQGYPWRMFAERPRHVSGRLERQFQLGGDLGQDRLFISRHNTPGDAAASIMRATRVLRAGMLLSVASDVRWEGPNTAEGRFLGRSYRFSAAWVAIASLSAATVVPMFCHLEPDGGYRVAFFPGYVVPPEGRKPEHVGLWVQRSLNLIEDQVRLDPANSIDYFFWSDDEEAGLARAG